MINYPISFSLFGDLSALWPAGGVGHYAKQRAGLLVTDSGDSAREMPHSLAYEGGPAPEKILPDVPEGAAWVSGYFAARAALPEIIDAPLVRIVQRRQLETVLPWAVRALDLPHLPMPTSTK